jgi:hypothetical protein
MCGVLRNSHWTDSGGTRRSHLLRTPLLECVLRQEGLSVQAWAGQYLLSNGKGRTELAADLSEVWVSAERLVGRPLDPLNQHLLDEL